MRLPADMHGDPTLSHRNPALPHQLDDNEDEEDTEAVLEPVGEENADTGNPEQQEEKTESENENEEDSTPADEENEETEEGEEWHYPL